MPIEGFGSLIGLRPEAKMRLKASTNKGPVLFFNGITHAYLESN